MNNGAGGLWDALRLAYAPAQREWSGPAVETRTLPPQASPAPEAKGLGEYLESQIDLAEERAAMRARKIIADQSRPNPAPW